MKIYYIFCAIIVAILAGVFITYIAMPLMIIGGIYLIVHELKRRFFQKNWQHDFYQNYSETASDALSPGKIIDVEFHEVN